MVTAVEDDNDELDVGSAAGDNWVSFCFLLLLRVTRGMVDHLGRLGGVLAFQWVCVCVSGENRASRLLAHACWRSWLAHFSLGSSFGGMTAWV